MKGLAMNLGDIIKEYLENHTVNQFIEDSGLSKAYTYNLINNRNNQGNAPVPTIDTINKVAKGVHSDFDTVFSKLDHDIVVSTSGYPLQKQQAFSTRYGEKKELRSKILRSTQTKLFNIFLENNQVSISINSELSPYIALLENPKVKDLVAASFDCTDAQIDAAINILETFKKGV